MIVQSPGERGYQSGIPAGLGRPSTGSRPPMNNTVTKPKPAQPMTKPVPMGPPKAAPKPQRMQAGMVNPLMPAGARKNVQTMTPEVTQGVQIATPSVLTPQQPVETVTAEVIPPHDYQGGSNNFTPTAQFSNRDAWNEWRRGRASFLG